MSTLAINDIGVDLVAGAACAFDCGRMIKTPSIFERIMLHGWIVVRTVDEAHLMCFRCYEEWEDLGE